MKIHKVYSKFGGYEFMLVRKPSILKGILSKAGLASAKNFRKSVATPFGATGGLTSIFPDTFLRDGWSALCAEPDTSSGAGLVGLEKDRIALFFNSTGCVRDALPGETSVMRYMCEMKLMLASRFCP